MLISSAVFCRSHDRATPSVTIAWPHYIVLRCGLIINGQLLASSRPLASSQDKMPWMSPLLLSCASCMGRHSWSATQQHHHLQSAACTSHQPALSADRNQRCETLFVALHRHTGQSRPVAISSGRHRSDPAQCGSNSKETAVVEGGQNLVVGLWGRPLSGS